MSMCKECGRNASKLTNRDKLNHFTTFLKVGVLFILAAGVMTYNVGSGGHVAALTIPGAALSIVGMIGSLTCLATD